MSSIAGQLADKLGSGRFAVDQPAGDATAVAETPARRADRAVICLLSAGLGLVTTIIVFYPGYMWYDSNSQLRMARSGYYVDLIPPVTTFIWSLLDRVLPGPAGLLIFDLSLFWVGLGLLAYVSVAPRWLVPILVGAVGLFPPIWAWLGAMVKDVPLGGALVLAYALLRYADRFRAWPAWWLGLGALLYGLTTRHNAAWAILPLAWLAGRQIRRALPPRYRSEVVAAASGLVVVATLLLLNMGLGLALTRGRMSHPAQFIMVHDLAAVSLATGVVTMPEFVLRDWPDITLNDITRIYSPDGTPQYYATTPPRARNITVQQAWQSGEFDEFRTQWLTAIISHPDVYLLHRAQAFVTLLGIGREYICDPFYKGPIGAWPNQLGLFDFGQALYGASLAVLDRIRYSILFRGWLYVVVLGAVLVAAAWIKVPGRAGILALGFSGLLYALGYFFASTCEFRYLWWSVVATCLIPLAVLIPDGRERGATT